ncbi:TAP-like protein-domain-containing protein [Pseudomassariella vexata]|uniref:TAP-like protein-domain-containing protein n=1 Tax=Pseudomassariella vexata TaxID=1141098 RepID=A0A1Y2EJY2_9PEZI|nr:TAP-like protein-domain-containing protein [Pseudomassariella vexata]ORY71862.1 TAP-like protein-domain-containing protein [Pseudomassariella vexata]
MAPSEKDRQCTPTVRPAPRNRIWGCRPSTLLLSLAFVWIVRYSVTINWHALRSTGDLPAHVPDDGGIHWDKIEPHEKLQWHPCFSAAAYLLRCARLTVPMDYHRPLNESADHPKVYIALVLAPGQGRTDDPASYAESPLLVNPGGPGGSGTMFVAAAAPMLAGIVGRNHDIIGFDPRGVGATLPKADCFEVSENWSGVDDRNTALMNRLAWSLSGHDVGLVNSSNVAIGKIDVRSRAAAQQCKNVSDRYGNNSIFQYANTANGARDMLSIVHAWDEWRSTGHDAKPAKPTKPTKPTESARHAEVKMPSHLQEMNSASESTSAVTTQGKLVYWGFSYGTLLGATFAAMFPDKVGRVILDGVVDADHYVEPVWMDSLLDADKIWDSFFSYCHEAGPRCALYRLGDSSTDIKNRHSEIMASLDKEPRIVLHPQVNLPVILTASDIKMVLFQSLYSPIVSYPAIADLLNMILKNRDLHRFTMPPTLPAYCRNISLPIWPDDAQRAVMCGDKRYTMNETLPELQKRFEDLASYSSFADVWMSLMMGCNSWDIEAKDPPMRWDDHPAHRPAPIETDFPLLFLSSHLDPVTPLHAALKMTRKFVNASIVEQQSSGHCSVSCTSICTIKHIRAYLNQGKLPPAPDFTGPDEGTWTTCDCDEKPWKQIRPQYHRGHSTADEKLDWLDNGDELKVEELLREHSEDEVEWLQNWSSFRALMFGKFSNEQLDGYQAFRNILLQAPFRDLRHRDTDTGTDGECECKADGTEPRLE